MVSKGRKDWSYPETSATLLRTLREAQGGVDDAAWARFVDIYGPVVRHLVHLISPCISDADTDEVVQGVFVRLVGVLRSGSYDPAKSKFRTYLSTLTRRLLVDHCREAVAQRRNRQVELDSAEQIAVEDDPGAWIDAKWHIACRIAAERRVMEESAISEQSRATWRLLSCEGLSVKDAAKRMGLPPNTVSKIKCRIEALIANVLKLYDGL